MSKIDPKSLYATLGGVDKLVPFIEGICGRMMRDGTLAQFFRGHNEKGKKLLQHQFTMYLIHAMGGPVDYCGDDLKTAHKGLAITPAEYDRFVALVIEAMEQYKLPKNQQEAFLSLINKSKEDIIELGK